eukprot:TRINITY_DN3529_c0_g1_i3.p1 TRINITY_DN3529_c0_g1~~TRINITY_DN3529_c0_g1_i3.p1  ORF type:complete len:1006 (+),score=248.55 TRINITY_DN3529_c0_g1_i3:2560-5577(+)
MFDGQGRRPRRINLGGRRVAPSSSEALMGKIRREREEREAKRKRENSAIAIQRIFRGYREQKKFRTLLCNEFDKAGVESGDDIRRWSLLSFRFLHPRDAAHENGRLMKLIQTFNVLSLSERVLPISTRLVKLTLGVVGTVKPSSCTIPREIGRFLVYAVGKNAFDPLRSGELFQAMWRMSQEDKGDTSDEWSTVLINVLKQCVTGIDDRDVPWTPLLQIENVWENVPAAKKMSEDPFLSQTLLRRLPLEKREGNPLIILSKQHSARIARNWTTLLTKVLEQNKEHQEEILESWIDQTVRLFGFLFEDMSLRSNSDLSEDFGLVQQLQEKGFSECEWSCVRWEMDDKRDDSPEKILCYPLTAKKRGRFKDNRDAFIALDAWKYDVATTLTLDGSVLSFFSLQKEESLPQIIFEKLASFLGCIFRCISMPFFHEGDAIARDDMSIEKRSFKMKEEESCSDRIIPSKEKEGKNRGRDSRFAAFKMIHFLIRTSQTLPARLHSAVMDRKWECPVSWFDLDACIISALLRNYSIFPHHMSHFEDGEWVSLIVLAKERIFPWNSDSGLPVEKFETDDNFEWRCAKSLLEALYERNLRSPFCDTDVFVAPAAALKQSMEFLQVLPFLVPFDERALILRRTIAKERHSHHGWYEGVSIRRGHALEDAFDRFGSEIDKFRSLPFRVRFLREDTGEMEEGLGDGVTKEFLVEVCKQGFDPNYGLFRLSERGFVVPNPESSLALNGEDRDLFRFLGAILGKALLEDILVDVPFAPFIMNKILSKSCHLADLESFDQEVFRNLVSLVDLEKDQIDELGLSFNATVGGEMTAAYEVELIPNGANIPVTSKNVTVYVQCYADFKLNFVLRRQLDALVEGFHKVIDPEWISWFNRDELRILISGNRSEINVDDWSNNTDYHGSDERHARVVSNFWEVVREMSEEEKQLLLRFSTSCARPPALGFSHLQPKFALQVVPDSSRFPSSATCFNMLRLPAYRSKEEMRDKLIKAITMTSGFGLS